MSATRTVEVSGGALDLTSGFVTGRLGTLTVSGGATFAFVPVAVRTRMNLSSATVAGTITIAANDTLQLVGGVLTASVVNNGLFLAQGTATLAGAFTAAAGSTLRVLGANVSTNAAFTVATGFTNNGVIDITSIDLGYSAGLTVTAGTLTNASGGTITVSTGSGGSRSVTGTLLDNFGTVTFDASTSWFSSIDQRGILNVLPTRLLSIAAGRVLTLYPGSTTTVTGTINNLGSCSNLGGAFSGFSCP